MVYAHTKVNERRRNITKLLVRGFTPTEIAEALSLSKDTIYNDIRYIRSGRNEDLAEYGRRQMLAQVMINARERVRELWQVVEKSESPYVKLLALRELRIHDQQVLNHLFLFTQVGPENTSDDKPIDNKSCQRVQPGFMKVGPENADNDKPINNKSCQRVLTADPSFSVKKRRKCNSGKGFQLQMDKRENEPSKTPASGQNSNNLVSFLTTNTDSGTKYGLSIAY